MSNILCAEIDFEEFLAIYKRVFVLSKSTVGDSINDITLQAPKLVPAELSKASQLPCIIIASTLCVLLLTVGHFIFR